MSVYTRKIDGRTYCIYNENGKPVWEPFGKGKKAVIAATERDLEIKKARLQGHIRAFHSDDISFADLYQQYAAARDTELSDKTVDEIFNTVTRYADPVIGQRLCRRITINDWHAIQKTMTDRGISNRSINTYFTYLSNVIGWGINNLDALRSMPHPWAQRKPLRITRKFKVDLLSLTELQAIFEHAQEHLKWAIEVEYHTGMRPGKTELYNLRWSDIDFETGAVRIYSSKTDTPHIQYIDQEFIKRLKEKRAWYRAEAHRLARRRGEVLPECPYVISFQGHRITTQCQKSWAEAKKKAGINKPVRLMDLRHFYITHALKEGANIIDLANRVGHVGPDMIVRVYSHLVEDLKQKAVLPIPSLYTGQTVDNPKVLDESIRRKY